jgi:hypothetical protein
MFQMTFAAFVFEIQIVGTRTLETEAESSFETSVTTNRHVTPEVLNLWHGWFEMKWGGRNRAVSKGSRTRAGRSRVRITVGAHVQTRPKAHQPSSKKGKLPYLFLAGTEEGTWRLPPTSSGAITAYYRATFNLE